MAFPRYRFLEVDTTEGDVLDLNYEAELVRDDHFGTFCKWDDVDKLVCILRRVNDNSSILPEALAADIRKALK